MNSGDEVTELLRQWSAGNQAALDRLMPLVYVELRRMASRQLAGEKADHTLQPTALIHEAYFRLVGTAISGQKWENRAHFFRVASKAMRHVIIDHAKAHFSMKRGGGQTNIPLEEDITVSPQRMASVVALHEALSDLDKLNRRQAEVVELKYFGGLTTEEIALTLRISPDTVMRDWRAAKAWLQIQLSRSEDTASGASA